MYNTPRWLPRRTPPSPAGNRGGAQSFRHGRLRGSKKQPRTTVRTLRVLCTCDANRYELKLFSYLAHLCSRNTARRADSPIAPHCVESLLSSLPAPTHKRLGTCNLLEYKHKRIPKCPQNGLTGARLRGQKTTVGPAPLLHFSSSAVRPPFLFPVC